MIPEGWERQPLGAVCELVNGRGFKPHEWGDTGYPIIRIQNLNGGSDFNFYDGDFNPKILVRPGQLLFAWSGSRGTSFGPHIWNGPDAVLNYHTWKVLPTSETDQRFLHQMLRHITGQIEASAHGASALVHTQKGDMEKWPIAVPPLCEQQKIADILSTWDAAIGTIEKLLANAEALKRALMQQLVAGKRRVNGFQGTEWQVGQLSDVASIIVSNVDKKTVAGEKPVRLCNYTDVYTNNEIYPEMAFMAATATDAQIKKFALKKDDVVITKDSETPADIAIPAYVGKSAPDLVCGYHLAIIRPNKRSSGRFLKYYFEHPITRHHFASRANGATRFGLTVGSIEEAVIRYPALEEQERIADYLSTVEDEIAHLQADDEHLRTEKRALMQQLLTGKRRVAV
ncbi:MULTISPECIES: restriction endonuclease subunit S [unclassified Mesorhizobium]|uniref:restriction endonuclease subunit S n=1 Tax=unclassified Mesorhizobium TaxID=325217 RepID=UPI00333A52CE